MTNDTKTAVVCDHDSSRRSGSQGRALAVASRVIPGGVNSNVRLEKPTWFAKASGSKLYDISGREYIDYALGMGPTILGHAPPSVLASVSEAMKLGQLFAGNHVMETELASMLKAHIPNAELVRLGMTGSEMAQAAIRLARAHTGRNGFIKFEGQYHGWFDNVLVNFAGPPNDPNGNLPFPIYAQTAGQSPGSTSETHVLPWNDADVLEAYLEKHASEIAAIITEPVMCNTGGILPRQGYFDRVKELCDRHGIILIIDEVITGFRVGPRGAQGRLNINGDLAIFAKAFGGGFPVAAITGKAELMRKFGTGEVNHSGTYNANLVSVAAGVATLEELYANDGALFGQIELIGNIIIDGIREANSSHGLNLRVSGFGSVFHTFFSDETEVYDYATYKKSDQQRQIALISGLLDEGIRPTSRGTFFVSAAHTKEDAYKTVAAVNKVLANISQENR